MTPSLAALAFSLLVAQTQGTSDVLDNDRPEDALSAARKRDAETEAKRDFWQQKMRSARQKLEALRDEQTRLTEERGTLQVKALAMANPDARARVAQITARLDALATEIPAQETYVNTGIYEEARKAGALPGWLRDAD